MDISALYTSRNIWLLQEVWHVIPALRVRGLRHLGEDLKIPVEVIVYGQHRGYIAAAVAVIGGAPHGHQVARGKVVLVALHHQLVRAADQLDVVVVVELQCVQWTNIVGNVMLKNTIINQ